MGPVSPPTTKDEARQHFRSARLALTSAERHAAAISLQRQVLQWLPKNLTRPDGGSGKDRLVAAYLSADPEPGTAALLESLTDMGYHVVVPICEPGYQLTWCSWRPGIQLRRSSRAALLEPVGQPHHFTELLDAHGAFDLVLVPGLAVDGNGSRLGQGGGYYDRFLAQLLAVTPSAPTAAYLYDHELLPAGTLMTTALDIPLAGVFTTTAFHRLGTDPGPV